MVRSDPGRALASLHAPVRSSVANPRRCHAKAKRWAERRISTPPDQCSLGSGGFRLLGCDRFVLVDWHRDRLGRDSADVLAFRLDVRYPMRCRSDIEDRAGRGWVTHGSRCGVDRRVCGESPGLRSFWSTLQHALASRKASTSGSRKVASSPPGPWLTRSTRSATRGFNTATRSGEYVFGAVIIAIMINIVGTLASS